MTLAFLIIAYLFLMSWVGFQVHVVDARLSWWLELQNAVRNGAEVTFEIVGYEGGRSETEAAVDVAVRWQTA